MQEQRIDLTALDPSTRDPQWSNLVANIAARAWSTRVKRVSVPELVVSWARPWLAFAAAAAAAVWVFALQAEETTPTHAIDHPADATLELAAWASEGSVPETGQVLALLEEIHADD